MDELLKGFFWVCVGLGAVMALADKASAERRRKITYEREYDREKAKIDARRNAR